MQINGKLRDISLKNAMILVSYIAVLVLGILYFDEILGFIGNLISIIYPFLIGMILAFILNIPYKVFLKKLNVKNEKAKRIISAALSVLLLAVIVILLILFIIPQLVNNVKSLLDSLPVFMSEAEKTVDYLLKQMNASTDFVSTIEKLQEYYGAEILSTVASWMPDISSWLPSIASGVTSITTMMIRISMSIVIAVYMLFSKDTLLKQVKQMSEACLNEKYFQFSLDVAHLTTETFENFLGGQLIESFIIAILCYIGCFFLDIPYASIAALVIGFTNIIPYFGPLIGAFICSLLIVLVSPVKALVFLVFSVILQEFESNLIYPHVVGNSVGLSALWVLFAVTVGGGLFGIPGMVFGLPTFSVIYELIKRWSERRIKDKKKSIVVEENS